MAFDAHREDYQRLSMSFAASLEGKDPSEVAQALASFGRRFAQERETLPQTTEDRAFRLVAAATEILDYRLPFVPESAAQEFRSHGLLLLEQALKLDPTCYDAMRMRAGADNNFDQQFEFLREVEPSVREWAEGNAEKARALDNAERAKASEGLAWAPYLRWLANLAEQALICGRNTLCIETCTRLLDLDPTDVADARFTLALAYAKAEDVGAFQALIDRYAGFNPERGINDPWIQLAAVALDYKSWYRRDDARKRVKAIVHAFPGSVYALVQQNELAEGLFARVRVAPHSEDELVVAISEATVLLQEGYETTGRGVFGTWLADVASELDPEAAAAARRDLELRFNPGEVAR